MTTSLSQLLKDSVQIAWDYLERTGELGDGAAASRFLGDTIEVMVRRGQRSRLVLSNRAIGVYQRFRMNEAVAPRSRSDACLTKPAPSGGRRRASQASIKIKPEGV
jgi:hypothetical protein